MPYKPTLIAFAISNKFSFAFFVIVQMLLPSKFVTFSSNTVFVNCCARLSVPSKPLIVTLVIP